jgi:predicted small lipoprotein YifL
MVRASQGECKVTRPIARLATVSVMALALALAACGRKGGLDLPPSASAAAPGPSASAAPGPGAGPYDSYSDGRPVTPNGPKKRLPIDVLLD